MRVVYYNALQAYKASMREYTAIVRNAAVPAGAAAAAAPVIVAVPPIIGSGAMSTAVAMSGPPPPLASVSGVAYDLKAFCSPGMTPMAATPSASNAPKMLRFTATGEELPVNEYPTDFDPSWLTLP